MIGAPVPGVVNALQVTIPGRSPSVPSVKALENARDEKRVLIKLFFQNFGKMKKRCIIYVKFKATVKLYFILFEHFTYSSKHGN